MNHTSHHTSATLWSGRLCVAALLLLLGGVGCDDEPAPQPTTIQVKKKPAAGQPGKAAGQPGQGAKGKGAKGKGATRPVAFSLQWTGETYRGEGDHISNRMVFFPRKKSGIGRQKLDPPKVIVPVVEGFTEEEAKDADAYKEGFCAWLAENAAKQATCPAEGERPEGLDTVTLSASVLTDPVALKAAPVKGEKKQPGKQNKTAKVASAANVAIEGTLGLNEGWEHFRFKLKFRATSPAPTKKAGWYKSLGSHLAEEWITRLTERLERGERTLKPSPAIAWVSSISENVTAPDEAPRYTTRRVINGHTVICLGFTEAGHSCKIISPTGESGKAHRFHMGKLGEHERRATKTWMRADPTRDRLLFVGEAYTPAKGEAPAPPLPESKQNVWIVSLSTSGELGVAAIVPDFYPHSPAITDADGNFYVAAWGVREMELVKASPKGEVLGTWRLPGEVRNEYDLILLDATHVAILPEGGDAILAVDTANPRARVGNLWRWPGGASPTFNDHLPHVTSDGAGGLLILDGARGEVRTAYRIDARGKARWKLRLGTSPAFHQLTRAGEHGVLLGEELRFVNLEEGTLDGRDSDAIHSVAAGPNGTIIGCSRSDVRIYEDRKPTERSVRLKNGCDLVAPHKDGFIALQELMAVGLGPVGEWGSR
ncbi:MAG: hypothetical protein CMH57_04050 [Myxococcales bacterium]|nr:hypothetical protein [Myxococcales bacterium]